MENLLRFYTVLSSVIITIWAVVPACTCTPVPRSDFDALVIPNTDGVPVVPFRWMFGEGGSAVILDDHRLITSKHVIPNFMLEAYSSGGAVNLVNSGPTPFLGMELDIGPHFISRLERGHSDQCFVSVLDVGESDRVRDDWAVLRTMEDGYFSIHTMSMIQSTDQITPGTPVYLIGYPAGEGDQVPGIPLERVVLGGRVVEMPGAVVGSDMKEIAQTIMVRLDIPGDYRGMSGGAAVIKDPVGGRWELIGVIRGSGPSGLCEREQFITVVRIPPVSDR